MGDTDEACMLGLSLELGLGGYVPKKEKQKVNNCFDLNFELCPKEEAIHDKEERFNLKRGHHPNEKSVDVINNKNGRTKKLKLTEEQTAKLEDSFKLHKTINPAQRQALAERLNLKDRQVEVWFQNRRARTKLKQTEVDCEFLKKSCGKLAEENLRLKKELQELRALKVGASPLYTPLSKAANWTLCSSCKDLLKPNEGNNDAISNVVRNSSLKLQSSIEL